MGDDSLTLESHDSGWSARFEAERDRIRARAGDDLLGVFHVGSTAVPNLPAKPVLDVLAVFADESAMRAAADELLAGEYVRKRNDDDWQVLNRFGDETVVLHLRPRDADTWRDQLVFREYLRENPGARAEYERAKRDALAEHPDDVDAYTDAKEATILSLTERAYEDGYGERLPAFA